MTARMHEHVGRLRCPKCGANANTGCIRYVESIECWRAVRGVAGGVVTIEGLYETGEGYDTGREPQFECHSHAGGKWCGHRWRAPAWLLDRVDWV